MESRAKRIRVNIILFICLAILLFCLCLPFIAMLGTSVKIRDAALSTWSLFPQTWTDFSLESYATVMTKTNFPMNILNTVVVCACVVVVCITIASMAGYAISRYKGAYFKGYSILLLMLQMFPTMLLLMPLYVTYTKLRLINTLWSVIISYSTMNLAFSIWMLKGFFDTIPTELEEAAVVDGCTRFFAFIRVILPLSLPGIATVAIFTILNA